MTPRNTRSSTGASPTSVAANDAGENACPNGKVASSPAEQEGALAPVAGAAANDGDAPLVLPVTDATAVDPPAEGAATAPDALPPTATSSPAKSVPAPASAPTPALPEGPAGDAIATVVAAVIAAPVMDAPPPENIADATASAAVVDEEEDLIDPDLPNATQPALPLTSPTAIGPKNQEKIAGDEEPSALAGQWIIGGPKEVVAVKGDVDAAANPAVFDSAPVDPDTTAVPIVPDAAVVDAAPTTAGAAWAGAAWAPDTAPAVSINDPTVATAAPAPMDVEVELFDNASAASSGAAILALVESGVDIMVAAAAAVTDEIDACCAKRKASDDAEPPAAKESKSTAEDPKLDTKEAKPVAEGTASEVITGTAA